MNRIVPGQLVYWEGSGGIVLELKGYSEVLLKLVETDTVHLAPVASIRMRAPGKEVLSAKHALAEKEQWEEALSRFEVIKPLLRKHGRSAEDVRRVASSANRGVATIYRWLRVFEDTGLVSSLMRDPRSDKGGTRLGNETEEIIEKYIQTKYLTGERVNVAGFYDDLAGECRRLGLDVPHINTVYNRTKQIEKREAITRRKGPKVAKQKFGASEGKFPGADHPYSVYQIDHTPVDCILVDREHRIPIGKPYLTIAIEVKTKMLAGFYLTLEHPGTLSAGMCIAHAVQEKEMWLAKMDISAEWPIYGKMDVIHVDNAAEFRGQTLRRACNEHNIDLTWRPVGSPNYGPHVERAFLTFMKKVHELPGTTFSNVAEKLEYDSDGKAIMTLPEFEKWFTTFVVYAYHHKPHKGISNVAPLKLYQKLLYGTDDEPGVGLPAPIQDMDKFRLDFTPYVERTIQREGVSVDHVEYFSHEITRWIGAVDPVTNKSRKFKFARDPRDISVIYFLDPEEKSYIPIPYKDMSRPAISLWELKAVITELRKDPLYDVNEEMIFVGVQRMREIEAESLEKTRLAKQKRATERRNRRMADRRKDWEGVHDHLNPDVQKMIPPESGSDKPIKHVLPLDDIELED